MQPQTISLALLMSFTLFAIQAVATSFDGRVVEVFDGDTITVLHNGVAQQVHLRGIDCPEKRQAFGNEAQLYTSELVLGKTIKVETFTQIHQGQLVGEVTLPGGLVLNQELVKAGLAWWDRRHSDDKTLGALEEQARIAKRGLWAQSLPLPPWEFRLKAIPPP